MFAKNSKAYSVYLLFRFVFSLAVSMSTVLSIVYHLEVVQLDAFQLVLVGTVLETSCFLFEIPTGVVADLYSRRRSVLIGMFLYGLGFLMEGALPWFAPVLLAQVVWGCGDTFITGALEAWIASEEEDKPIDKVFLRGSQMGQIGGVLGVVLGTLVALLLYLTENRLFTPNHALNVIVGFIVNAIRSLPFLILMVVLIPVAQFLLGDPYTPTGGAISLSIAAVPFFARIAESAFSEIDPGLLEAAISTGATTRQIIVDAVFPQALPSFIRGVVLTIISLIGYSAMVGTIGAGGIGDMAIQYGYNRYETGVLVAIVIILIVIVQIIQWIGDAIARTVTH